MTKDELRLAVARCRGLIPKTETPEDAYYDLHIPVEQLPRWPDSMDDCIKDLAPEIEADKNWTYFIELARDKSKYHCVIMPVIGGDGDWYEGYADTPSEAFCKVYKAWKEGNDGACAV